MNQYHPKVILVTGGAGFIGGHYVETVLSSDKDCRVINLDAMTYAGNLDLVKKHQRAYSSRYQFVQGSILNEEVIDAIFDQWMIDTVVHFAAESHVDNSLKRPDDVIATNVNGTHKLLKSSLKYWQKRYSLSAQQCRFHHISTDEVYGSLLLDTEAVFTELSPYQPNSPYSASKAASDHLVRAYAQSYGLPVTVTHSSNNFGARQHNEKLIPTIIHSCLTKEKIPIYGDGCNMRDWVYVVDNCHMIHTVICQGDVGHTYNIGAGKALSNLDLCQVLCDLMGELLGDDFDYRKLISFVRDRLGHDVRYAISMDKYNQAFGRYDELNFDDALRATIRSFLGTYLSSRVDAL